MSLWTGYPTSKKSSKRLTFVNYRSPIACQMNIFQLKTFSQEVYQAVCRFTMQLARQFEMHPVSSEIKADRYIKIRSVILLVVSI